MKLNKRERRAAKLLTHYATCERLYSYVNTPEGSERSALHPDGKKISVALFKLERIARWAATAYCNGEKIRIRFPKFGKYLPLPLDYDGDTAGWEHVSNTVKDCVRNILGKVPPGFFVNGDARGCALKINDESPEGKALIESVEIPTDMGGYGILSPEITGD